MTEYIEQIVSTTIFLILMMLLRAVFYNRISKRVCYAMWLGVGFYLLASFGEFTNSFQVLNVIYRAAESKSRSEVGKQEQSYLQSDVDYGIQEAAGIDFKVQNSGQKNDTENADPTEISGIGQKKESQEWEKLTEELWTKELWTEGIWIKRIWFLGCIICVTIFAGNNLHFSKRLRKNRKLLEMDRKFRRFTGNGYISVYQTEEISTPCLFGVVRPAIYLPNTQMEQENCDYVLAHEYTHYRHGDSIWVVLRCLCISLYWYHPLVWLAALLSRRDSEFACDESVTRTYDAKERKAYGETLILFGTGGDGMKPFTGASGINGGNEELKARITWIAAQKKQHAGTAVIACVLLLGVTGCTIGSPTADNKDQELDRNVVVDNNSDLVPEPYDFAGILEKTEENGIAYYKVITEKDMPLPLNEWAKINIFTEQGNAVDAYVRFTQVIRDVDEIKEHVNHYIEVREIKEPFGILETDREQCVLLQYEILIANDAKLEENDRIPSMALDYPLRLYSTMESGRFAIQGIERSVCDLSILKQDKIDPGDTIKKEVICYIPNDCTAYGMELAYMTAQRTTNMVYFKPEYE
ncbi:MAG: M56 family metallopeptidase [Lachnospiraceae bacterium]|nr:M56 family metallopeptidase [Lachnospiraceae bacterium]